MNNNAIVCLSGGQDSATCLSWSKFKFNEIHSVSFYYGQRHSRELECAKKLSKIANVKSHQIINIEELFKSININNNAMIDDQKDVNSKHHILDYLPATFVPFRNLFLISSAAAVGLEKNATHVVTGICQTDYSGYPDCREDFKKSLQHTLSKAIDMDIQIHAPLMYLNKAETVKLMNTLGSIEWYKYTHTCYNGENPPCGQCPSCKLRANGFKETKIDDPLLVKNNE